MITSNIIAGCMNLGKWGVGMSTQEYLSHIKCCLDNEITTFDHADIYGHYTTEAEFGDALKYDKSIRPKIQLITKCGICLVTPNRPLHRIKYYNTSKTHILASVDQSLDNLSTDYLDLLLIHRPDPLMDPEEIAEAFHILKQSGKVLHFGVSNFSVSQVSLLKENFNIEVNQFEASILNTKSFYDGTTDYCIKTGIKAQAWSPLAAGKLQVAEDDERSRRILAMSSILGEKYNASFDQILLSWLMKHPANIIPVLGTTKIERLKAAKDAIKINLTREEWHMLLRAAIGHDVP